MPESSVRFSCMTTFQISILREQSSKYVTHMWNFGTGNDTED
jgi:hypothetical protein